MHKYRLIRKLGEGTFSEVLKAQSVQTGQYVAIKCMKSHFDSIDQVQNLREIKALQRLSPHPHIIQLIEVLYDEPTGRLALVFELMEMNFYEAIKGRPNYLPEQRVKHYMYQLLKAIEHMHRNGIFHRDIKPENILLMGDTVKLADLGSCRGLYSKPPFTEYISTRWYRAPECLLTDGYYGYKMDIWGAGCVFFEILSLFPLFPGNNELDQINKIHNIMGTPPQELLDHFQKHATHMEFNFQAKKFVGIAKLIPHVSADAQDIIMKMLIYNPDERYTASQILKHNFFKELREQDQAAHHHMSQITAGPNGFTKSVSSSNHMLQAAAAVDNLSQYSRRNSDNVSETGGDQSFHSKSFNKKNSKKNGGQVDKKKVLPTKKFPELKLMISGEGRNSNNTFSSDEDAGIGGNMQFPPIKKGGANVGGGSVVGGVAVAGGSVIAQGPGGPGGANDNYVKNIKKNPQGQQAPQPGNGNQSQVKGAQGSGNAVVSGLGIQGGQIPAEFRQTMKHNNSNQSISGKKFMGQIKKHGENGGGSNMGLAVGAGSGNPNGSGSVIANPIGGGAGGGSTIGMASGVVIPNNMINSGAVVGNGKKNYMSPYSQKIVQKPGN